MAAVLLGPATAGIALVSADPRTARLVESLKSSDYRVRTNAALALGSTADDDAVAPLCAALSDDSDVVRQAGAAALKRLGKPNSVACLKTQLARESSDAVKLQITRALESLEIAAPPANRAPVASGPNPNAKYYVSLSSVTNRTTRTQPEVEGVVMKAMRAKMDTLGTFEVAPAREGLDSAKATIAKRKLKGFYLAISVDPMTYDNGTMATVKVAVFSYPNKDLRAEVPARGIVNGDKGDTAVENAAIEFAAAKAIELIAKNADRL